MSIKNVYLDLFIRMGWNVSIFDRISLISDRKTLYDEVKNHPVRTYFNPYVSSGVWDDTRDNILEWVELIPNVVAFFVGVFLTVWKLLQCTVLYPFIRLYIIAGIRYKIKTQEEGKHRESHQTGWY